MCNPNALSGTDSSTPNLKHPPELLRHTASKNAEEQILHVRERERGKALQFVMEMLLLSTYFTYRTAGISPFVQLIASKSGKKKRKFLTCIVILLLLEAFAGRQAENVLTVNELLL